MDIDLADLRVLSLLNECPNYADSSNGDRYVVYAGYVFRSDDFRTLFMCSMFGRNNLYDKHLDGHLDRSIRLRRLNQHDELLQQAPDAFVTMYLRTKIEDSLSKLSPDDIDAIVSGIPMYNQSI